MAASSPGGRKVLAVTSDPSRTRLVSRASPASVVQQSVGRYSGVVRVDAEEVVGSEERLEPGPLGGPRQREDVGVTRSVAGLHEHPHADPALMRRHATPPPSA